ncbi:MAG: hypothetical protein NC218_00775 [Acetobacter sp.]|nr:hypothetical protein [Acetobacter sp.]
MKYIYIICLLLSSIFTYKPLSANIKTHYNAFFIPNGAFQQNTYINNSTTQQRFPKTTNTSQIKKPQKTVNITTSSKSQPKKQQQTITPQNTTAKTTASTPKAATQLPKKITKKIPDAPKKQVKYQLEDTIIENKKDTSTTQTPAISTAQFKQNTMSEMLETLPYPDFKQPKYKQLYALYGLDLRTTYRQGKLPSNYEQEKALSKANSIRRFEVK